MRCEYYWFQWNSGRTRESATTQVQCENEATEYTELPSANKFNTNNVCAKCLERIEIQEYVNKLVESGELNWEEDESTDDS